MKDVENFMNKNYRIALQYDPDGYWIAEHPELPGCKADGETAQEAVSSLDISRALWIEASIANGLEVPEPQAAPEYSGKFVLRLPKSLHRDLAQEAEAEGVSLNSYVSNVLASRHAKKEQAISFVVPPVYPQMANLYSAHSAPETISDLLPNICITTNRQQSPRQNQVIPFEGKQMQEKERQYA